jgi:tRNA(adenine34) deaminase
MALALAQASHALDIGEIPVGAVVVDADGAVVGAGCNETLTSHDPSAHAEMVALRKAALALSNYRLPGLSMYVTLEPCPMCTGLLIHARLKHLWFGTPDPRTGACGSVFSLIGDPRHNHHVEVSGGILQDECSKILKDFFKLRRAQAKALNAKRIAPLVSPLKILDGTTVLQK